MRVYIAAPYAARPQVQHYALELDDVGIDVTSSWLGEDIPLTASNLGAATGVSDDAAATHAETDFDDIDRCDVLVLITESVANIDPALCVSGGRHVETGYAIARGKEVLVVGRAENIFHRSRRATVVPDWPTAFVWLLGSSTLSTLRATS